MSEFKEYVFAAKGRVNPRSDLDLAVLFTRPPEDPLARFEAAHSIAWAVQDLVKRPVDVVDLAGSPLILQSQVARYGFLLYEGSRKARVAYEVGFRRRYFDFKPLWEAHARKRIEAISGDGGTESEGG